MWPFLVCIIIIFVVIKRICRSVRRKLSEISQNRSQSGCCWNNHGATWENTWNNRHQRPERVIQFVIVAIFTFIQKMRENSRHGRPNSMLQMYGVGNINAIVDRFPSLDEVSEAIRQAGLESSNLIFGIDYTASNQHQGQRTFGGRSLHDLNAPTPNPYQQVISIMGETLRPFDDDGVIPVFGFGDISTTDKNVFSLMTEGYRGGFQDALQAYRHATAHVQLSGPTSFAPLIYKAIEIVRRERSYHILVIIADGQVTSVRPTRDAIVEASKWPLSIVMVGVGDGPWDMMHEFDDQLPARRFDNFQFVDFNKIMAHGRRNMGPTFALHALMEIPDQYKAIRNLGLLDMPEANAPPAPGFEAPPPYTQASAPPPPGFDPPPAYSTLT